MKEAEVLSVYAVEEQQRGRIELRDPVIRPDLPAVMQ
jgi:DNA-directed RNA polymerase subunit H (RpoH/RPB5)